MSRRSTEQIIRHGDDLVARFENAEPNPLDDDQHQAVIALRTAVTTRSQAEAEVLAQVRRARSAGVTWSVLGIVLGTSGEAARQRYTRLIDA